MLRKLSIAVLCFLKTDFGIALVITIIWKFVMLGIGYFVDNAVNTNVTFLNHTVGWDSNWYINIVHDHYTTNGPSAVFYPLFPLLVGLVQLISFTVFDPIMSAQVINTIAVWLTLTALFKIGKILLDKNKSFWLIALVLSAPAAFFMHLFYSEALFMALGFWAYLFALRHRWLYMGITLAILTATRLPAVLFIALCLLEFMRAYDWKIQHILNKKLLYFLIAPLGFIFYGIYLLIIRGDFFAMFHAYKLTSDWSYQVLDPNILKTIGSITFEVGRATIGLRPFDNDITINHLIPLIALVILGACSLYLIIKKRGLFLPIGIAGLISIVMFTLNSNIVSAHRYILPCLSIYFAIVLFTKVKYQSVILICVCAAGFAVQVLLFALFVSHVFVG